MRLIDADMLLRRIEQSKLSNPHTDVAFKRAHEAEHCHFLYMVIDMPTVEPKQGEWIDDGDTLICNNCKTAYNRPLFHNGWNYCPNCGCRMKGMDDAD